MIRTLDQVAADYGFHTTRQLREFARRRGIPYFSTGKVITFNAAAIVQLEEALRCPSKSSADPTRAPSRSPARSTSRLASDYEFDNARNQIRSALRPKRLSRSKPGSSGKDGTGSAAEAALSPQP
jgi:hypothetical protein